MSQTLAAPAQRMNPFAGFVIALALAATLLLGFGLRTWTESSPHRVTPAVTTSAPGAAPQPICRIGRPC